jgi:hypothetical protein
MITYSDLEIRNEDELAAAAITRVSDGLATETVEAQISERQGILKHIAARLKAPV